MNVAPNPRRPHQFQTSDSTFGTAYSERRGKWFVIERWWFINRNREEEDGEQMHGPFDSETEALQACQRLESR